MNYKEYYSARDKIEQIIKADLLGPVDENEIITESPVSYYLLGKLYPRNIAKIEDEQVLMERDEKVFTEEEMLTLGSGRYPSAMGITFSVTEKTESFEVFGSVAWYEQQEKLEGKPKEWKRKTKQFSEAFSAYELIKNPVETRSIHRNLELQVHLHRYHVGSSYKLTATLVNNSSAEDYSYDTLSFETYFQPQIKIGNIKGGTFTELSARNGNTENQEDKELELLYHDCTSYAVGHGCSASWHSGFSGEIDWIQSEVIPEYELLQMRPANCISGRVLSIKFLSKASYEEIKTELYRLLQGYENWIQDRQTEIPDLKKGLQQIARNNLEKCLLTLKRLESAITILKEKDVLKAFQYANETMLNQRKCMVRDINENEINWYPFQLAFFLQEIESLVYPEREDHKLVDLLWFPTGGGKTEAYLGIAAFTIFYRRIREMQQGREDKGVAVIMRYTLRLLSFQQFERASAMICAAEVIRRRDRLGNQEFGIALWAGRDLTPNTMKEAEDYLMRNRKTDVANPIQVTKCPWCGSKIQEEDYSIDKVGARMKICCPQKSCLFHGGLPIHLVDEDIYAHKPSFLVGTVDKFARIAFKEEAGELLGIDLPCPPELIIQDELHLISGPLGTITGIYEAAITKLCERNGIKPKIIASTATIKNADHQIKSLYGTNCAQFPPQGLTMKDSYFAELADRNSKAARKYLGFWAAGSSRATAFVRITGSLLFASRYLEVAGYSDEVIDAFWTETGYFNTLRELGSAMIRIIDNVQDQYHYLKNIKLKEKYPIYGDAKRYDRIYEMTSRQGSADLGSAIQDVLMKNYKRGNLSQPLDFLIASNMISVGVDVARLNNMIVVGQPMKSSEYIQSTSRVGRTTPGLVMVLYHPSLSRDRSHYESFLQFHSAMYKYVEATSVTPFADRARDRALQALYIILCRYLIPQLRTNKGAANYSRYLPELEGIRTYIREYVEIVDPEEEENLMEELEELEIEWDNRASHTNTLVYYDYKNTDGALFDPDYMENSRFRMMNSMRSVEPSVEIKTLE